MQSETVIPNRENIPTDLDRVNSKPLTKAQLADFLGVKPRTVERYMKLGLPYIALGKPRFDLPTVMDYLRTKMTVRAN